MKYDHINTIYIVMAVKRTGHHGIMDWLRFSYDKDVVFYNDPVYPKNPHDTAYNFWINKHLYVRSTKNLELLFPKKLNCLVWNYEDFDLKTFDEDVMMSMVNDITESYDRIFFITINRDPFNHQASMVFGSEGLRKVDTGVWKEYAKEHLGKTNYVPNGVHIDYSLWMRDVEDKKKLYEKIGGTKEYIDFYKTISGHGNGSSFNRQNRDAKEILKNILVRWKRIMGTDYLKEITSDKEIIKLSKQIYGEDFVDEIYNR